MKKILIHTLVFSPDGVSTAYLYNDIALKFQERGYEVVVLTSTPHFNPIAEDIERQPLYPRALGLYFVSDFKGVRVLHVPQKKYRSTFKRMLGFVYWHAVSFMLAMKETGINIILSPSPPLTLGLVNIVLGRLKGARVIYNVQEIYPDFLIKERNLTNLTIVSMLKWVERTVYNKSDAITTIDTLFYETIVNRFDDRKKLHVIPNFVNTSIYKKLDNFPINLAALEFPQEETLKVMYAGNIGLAQDWKLLISIAQDVREESIEFLVIGEGAMKGFLATEIANRNLENIHLIPYQSRSVMPAIINNSDIQFIFMTPNNDNHGFPSKIYTIMACGKPMLISSGPDTPIVRFLEGKDCAYIYSDNDIESRRSQIVKMLRSNEIQEFEEKGKNGFGHIIADYSHEVIPNKYVELADSLIGG